MGDYETEISLKTTRSKELEQQLGASEARLQKVTAENHDLTQKQSQIIQKKDALQDAFAREREEHVVSKRELADVKGALRTYQKFSVKMDDLYLPKLTSKLEGLWEGLIELVGRFIGHDLQPAILQGDWTVLNKIDIFKPPMTLPKSNSITAKRVRVALVVRVVSMLIDRFIFRPNYLLLEEGSEMRDVLFDQAMADEKKERHLRGILLSMFADDQEKTINGHISSIMEDVLREKNVQVLLEMDRLEDFSGQLQKLVVEFSKEWKAIQRARQKIEPDFSTSPSNSQIWYILDEHSTSPGNGDRSSTTLDTSNIEGKVVVIPPMYLLKQGQEPEPITHGYIFEKAHIDAAAEEVRRTTPSAPIPQTSLNRHRSRSHRTSAVDGVSRRVKAGSFLS
ncbi:hypothetical protein DM02DRAFT_677149 [Periconia macrospinosa]|uniref:Uncharacterized protein n=1 Tax=Periconia macrospinosa TaxID=97972 RepID=A0A2V1D4J3_9PLEO|nr:hypothetical protein DM02DRAFT_677149 [Periconia macrospinosa]